MSKITLSRAIPADADALIDGNRNSALYHSPWVRPFTDYDGFDAWYGKTLTGPNLGYVVRHLDSGMIVGVVNLTEIVWGVFRSAYLSYYGMVDWSRTGLMTEGVELACRHAFDELRLHWLEANIQPGNAALFGADKTRGLSKRRLFCKLFEDFRRMARSRAVGAVS